MLQPPLRKTAQDWSKERQSSRAASSPQTRVFLCVHPMRFVCSGIPHYKKPSLLCKMIVTHKLHIPFEICILLGNRRKYWIALLKWPMQRNNISRKQSQKDSTPQADTNKVHCMHPSQKVRRKRTKKKLKDRMK